MSRKKGSTTTATKSYLTLFEGTGEMAALMRAYDWDAHPMGNPEYWPDSLKTTIRLMLQSNFPMFIWWSPDLYMFHNDAYLPALGKKHPQALGASAREMWAEVWEQIGEIVEKILQGGKPFYARELQMTLERKGFSEETYWTFSYSAAPNDEGGVGGIFCACNEETKSVLAQRRMKTIKDIADATTQVETVEEASQLISQVLSDNKKDIPISLIYLLNGEETKARLLGQSGQLPLELAPAELGVEQVEQGDIWHLAKVRRSRKRKTSQLPFLRDPSLPVLPGFGPYGKAVTLPVLTPGEDKLLGCFVCGLSPKLEYDADYYNFLELLTGQIASSLASVQARQEAERKRADLMQLFQQAPVAIAVFRGYDFVVEFANAGMCELWGRNHEEVIDKPVFEALQEASGHGLEESLKEVLDTGTPYVANELPVTLNRKGKPKRVYVNLVYHSLRNLQGSITGITAIAVEVSEQIEARQEIEAKNRELMAINADLDNFIYSASHDLKGPIINIEGLMKVLIPKLPADCTESPQVDKIINMIFNSVERFKITIADLSEVSKLQKNAHEEVRILDIREVVKDVQSDMELDIQESGAKIETHFHCQPFPFSPKNLRSVVYNLLSNAIKYRSPERKPHIRLHCEVEGAYIVFSVTDNGLGIRLKDEEKVFTMFKRLHSHVEGSGVGLYIVKRIVENARGQIEVESKLGEGSTFRVFFRR